MVKDNELAVDVGLNCDSQGNSGIKKKERFKKKLEENAVKDKTKNFNERKLLFAKISYYSHIKTNEAKNGVDSSQTNPTTMCSTTHRCQRNHAISWIGKDAIDMLAEKILFYSEKVERKKIPRL